jgi:hypothetical protein
MRRTAIGATIELLATVLLAPVAIASTPPAHPAPSVSGVLAEQFSVLETIRKAVQRHYDERAAYRRILQITQGLRVSRASIYRRLDLT